MEAREDLNFGLWSFESALVTVLFDLDDAEYRKMTFYPKDLVDYARSEQYKIRQEKTEQPDAQIWGGNPATYTGKWICPLMLEASPQRIQYFKKGDILPAGESSKGTFVWNYLGDDR